MCQTCLRALSDHVSYVSLLLMCRLYFTCPHFLSAYILRTCFHFSYISSYFLRDVSFQVPYMLSFLTVLIFLRAFNFLRAYILFTCFLFPYILSHFLRVFIFVKCFKFFAYHTFLHFCMPYGASFFSSQFQIKEGRGKSNG